jgi:putative general porin
MSSRSSSLTRLIGAAVAGMCAAFAAQAEEFSWQLSGGTSRAEAGPFSRDSWAVDGTYYVNPIDDGDGPYALASFLHPTTRASAATSQSHTEYRDDPTAFTLNGAYVLPGNKWYVGANYAKTDLNEWDRLVTRSDEKGYGVLAGRYLGASTTVELRLGRSEHSFESFECAAGAQYCSSSLADIPYALDTTTDAVGLDVFHVRRFRSLTYSLQGSISQSEADFDLSSPVPTLWPTGAMRAPTLRVYSVAGELFPTNRLGVRVGYSTVDDPFAADAESYDVGATWFFKARVAVQFTLSRTSVDNGPFGISNTDGGGIRFIGRL